jgi:hypothetical protein
LSNKCSSLVQKLVNYGKNKFYSIGPISKCYKRFFFFVTGEEN